MGGAASRWVEDFSPGALKAIGALEFLAAAGLIVPAVLGIAPVLVPLAATGAVLPLAGAVIMLPRRGSQRAQACDVGPWPGVTSAATMRASCRHNAVTTEGHR
jgi:DoxX-like family